MLSDTKPSNPKDRIGITKLALGLIPFSGLVEMALAFLEGMFKYGRFNWRVAGVRSSVYADAILRHFGKWYNGEDRDPKTRVHHLGSMMACCAIVIDAMVCGKLEDDRPPAAPVGKMIDDAADTVAHLRSIFADHAPRQWTIADSVATGDAWEPIDADDGAYTTTITVEDGGRLAEYYSGSPLSPTDAAYEAAGWRLEGNEWLPGPNADPLWGATTKPDPTDEAYEAAACLSLSPGTRMEARYSASPASGVTLGPYSSQEALDKALYRWANYREILGETEDQREARLRREQEQ